MADTAQPVDVLTDIISRAILAYHHQFCPQLTIFDIRESLRRIDAAMLAELRKQRPDLVLIDDVPDTPFGTKH